MQDSFRLRHPRLGKNFEQKFFYLAKIAIRQLRTGDYQIVEPVFYFRNMFAESLFESPLCFVSDNALPHFFADGESDSHTAVGRSVIEYDETFPHAGAVTV